jgi:hypothetical protein
MLPRAAQPARAACPAARRPSSTSESASSSCCCRSRPPPGPPVPRVRQRQHQHQLQRGPHPGPRPAATAPSGRRGPAGRRGPRKRGGSRQEPAQPRRLSVLSSSASPPALIRPAAISRFHHSTRCGGKIFRACLSRQGAPPRQPRSKPPQSPGIQFWSRYGGQNIRPCVSEKEQHPASLNQLPRCKGSKQTRLYAAETSLASSVLTSIAA